MRNLCCKCPHYYEQHGYECDDVDWGCAVYGREFKDCPSFNDGEGIADFEEWGCNEKQCRIQYTLMRIRKKSHALGKICYEKEQRFYKKIYSLLPKEDEGYKAYVNGEFQGFYTRDYRQNMKGGHRHNHIYNVCNRITFRGKNSRQVASDDKKHFVQVFWANIGLMPNELNKILAKRRKRK